MRIAWTQNWGFERKPVGYFAIWVADIETGELVNYTLVESDRESTIGKWAENVDFYRLKLDGRGEMVRLTFFAESGRFKGTNPMVSADGRFIAFQVPSSTLEAGLGQGIYLYDIEMAKEAGVKP